MRLSCRAAVLAAAVLAAAPVRAASAGPVAEPPPLPPASAMPMKLKLGYDGRILVKIVQIEIEQEAGPRAYAAKAHMTTHGVLALFRKINLKAVSTGAVVAGKLIPSAFFHDNTDGKRERKVETVWADNEVKTVSEPAFEFVGDPPASQAQKREASDPLTGIMRLALAPADAATPCGATERMFDGKQRYDVDFIPAGPGVLDAKKQKLGLTDPVRCRLHYRPVAGFKKKSAEDRKEGLKKDVVIDLARVGVGGPWVISSMGADTFLGTARVELVRLDYSGRNLTLAAK